MEKINSEKKVEILWEVLMEIIKNEEGTDGPINYAKYCLEKHGFIISEEIKSGYLINKIEYPE